MDFNLNLVLFDLVPVVLFGVTFILFGVLIESPILICGSSICLISGLIKVFHKLIICLKNKNIKIFLYIFRGGMISGFIIMITGFLISLFTKDITHYLINFIHLPSLIFLIIGIFGIILMFIFLIKLDKNKAKNNWIEEITNSIIQLSFLLSVIFVLII